MFIVRRASIADMKYKRTVSARWGNVASTGISVCQRFVKCNHFYICAVFLIGSELPVSCLNNCNIQEICPWHPISCHIWLRSLETWKTHGLMKTPKTESRCNSIKWCDVCFKVKKNTIWLKHTCLWFRNLLISLISIIEVTVILWCTLGVLTRWYEHAWPDFGNKLIASHNWVNDDSPLHSRFATKRSYRSQIQVSFTGPPQTGWNQELRLVPIVLLWHRRVFKPTRSEKVAKNWTWLRYTDFGSGLVLTAQGLKHNRTHCLLRGHRLKWDKHAWPFSPRTVQCVSSCSVWEPNSV